MTRGTVFNAGDDYPNAEASPGLSAEDARIELLFIERAQAGVVVHELGRQRREGKTVKLCMTLPLRVALDQGFGDFRHGSPLPQNMPQIGAEMSLEMLLDPKTGKKNIAFPGISGWRHADYKSGRQSAGGPAGPFPVDACRRP